MDMDDVEVEATAAIVAVDDVVEEESLTGPKSAHRKGLGHAPVLISSTVSSGGCRRG